MKEKTIAQSRSMISEIMMIHQANPMGNVHGGEIMKIMDNAGSVAASRHAKTNVVTLRVDELIFHHPIYVGQLVTCTSHLVYVGNTSMEVKVIVMVEDITKDDPPKIAQSAFFTFVALDYSGKPTQVPRLKLETEQEKKEYDEGAHRAAKRKKT